jgi:hypothetical protein
VTAADRVRFAKKLSAALTPEEMAESIDGHFGSKMMAALLATPRGPARAFEAAKWARRAAAAGIDHVAVLIDPNDEHDREDWVDAHTELHMAITNEQVSR